MKELRDRTGAGFSDCRAALVEAGGDIEQAINVLRKKGQAAAAKKAQRATSEGLVSCYIHAGGKIGVLVEINCESDFVARTEDFPAALPRRGDAHRRARSAIPAPRGSDAGNSRPRAGNLSASRPRPPASPRHVIEKIVTGKMEKFYEENCLYEQHFIKDEGTTVKELVDQAIAKVGENIAIRRFSRFKVGETDGARRVRLRRSEAAGPAPKT